MRSNLGTQAPLPSVLTNPFLIHAFYFRNFELLLQSKNDMEMEYEEKIKQVTSLYMYMYISIYTHHLHKFTRNK